MPSKRSGRGMLKPKRMKSGGGGGRKYRHFSTATVACGNIPINGISSYQHVNLIKHPMKAAIALQCVAASNLGEEKNCDMQRNDY